MVEIDTFWNVKVEYLERYIQTPQIVEIDTFWNVKMIDENPKWKIVMVEIDTFWNVKKAQEERIPKVKTRRNRYILECKAKICLSTKCPAAGRNRYILECKVFTRCEIRETV